MISITFLTTSALVVAAALIDLRQARIPNRLTLPFLAAGFLFATTQNGLAGFEKSLGGVALAVGSLGLFCWLRALGMGDLKLCAAVGAWVGGTQMAVALVGTAVAGAVMALLLGWWRGSLDESLDGASELVTGFHARALEPHPVLRLDHRLARKMPYAPAIAAGVLFSFLAS